jgi:hypothetical protein
MADQTQAMPTGPLGDASAAAAETPDQRAMRNYRSRMAPSLGAFAVSLAVLVFMHWPWMAITLPVGDVLGRATVGYLMRRRLPAGLGWYELVMYAAIDVIYMAITAPSWTACSLALHRHAGH